MRFPARLLALGCCCFLLTSPVFGWWETGHQIVARIAANHLTPAARVRVSRILGVPDTPEAVAAALAQASTWADETKNETHTGSWHYVDLTLQDSKSDLPARCEKGDCVTVKIREFATQLANTKQANQPSEADALRYLVHFVGDIHQPLHAISDADLGGNCESLNPQIGDAKNIHALWDGEIVRALEGDDVSITAHLEDYIKASGPSKQSDWNGGNADDWAWESHQLARENIYGKLHIPTEPPVFPHGCKEAPTEILNFHPQIDTLYIDSMKPVVRDQLAKAGLRLARMLNEAL